jgi:PAS domain S-box-containing protein
LIGTRTMAQLLIFTALVQSILITFVLGKRATRHDLPALLVFLLMANYSLALFSGYWNANFTTPLTRLHIPIGYASGPVFYYFVRFSFLPLKNITRHWLWWFAPFVLEFANALIYWSLFAFQSPLASTFKEYALAYSRWSFLYFIVFFVAAIIFLVRNNTLLTLNIVYKRQLKSLNFLLFFIFLFILDELLTGDNEIFFSSLIACCFTSTFIYFLINDSQTFIKQNNEGKELLKEALNEQEKAVVIINKDRIVEYVNEPFLTIVGYRHRDIIGRQLTFLQGNLTTEESKDFMNKKLAEKVDFDIEIINYRKNGKAFMCHITMIPVFSDEELTHFVAYEEDIATISEAAPQDDELALLEKIKAHFQASESYKNKQLQVADISEAMGIPARRVGEILKKCEDKSFSEFVNAYRVQAVITMLKDTKNQNITIEAMGQLCGFNSKSVFHAAFKKETGKTPKAFLEEIES